MRLILFTTLMAFLFLLILVGCAQPGSAPGTGYEKAGTFKEQIAYTSAGIGAAVDTLKNLTCDKYVPSTGKCATPSRPLHPAASMGYLTSLQQSEKAAQAAATMPSTGGACAGTQVSTPSACLQLANTILSQIQIVLQALVKE